MGVYVNYIINYILYQCHIYCHSIYLINTCYNFEVAGFYHIMRTNSWTVTRSCKVHVRKRKCISLSTGDHENATYKAKHKFDADHQDEQRV